MSILLRRTKEGDKGENILFVFTCRFVEGEAEVGE